VLVLNARSIAVAAAAPLAAALLAACASTPASTPRSRVARDLGCTTEGTQVSKIGDVEPDPRAAPEERKPAARWRVTGCGKSAVYVCTTPVRDCWREGEIQQQPPVDGSPPDAPAPAATVSPAPPAR